LRQVAPNGLRKRRGGLGNRDNHAATKFGKARRLKGATAPSACTRCSAGFASDFEFGFFATAPYIVGQPS